MLQQLQEPSFASLRLPADLTDGEVRQKAEEYSQKKSKLEAMQEKAVAYQKAKIEYSTAVFHDSV